MRRKFAVALQSPLPEVPAHLGCWVGGDATDVRRRSGRRGPQRDHNHGNINGNHGNLQAKATAELHLDTLPLSSTLYFRCAVWPSILWPSYL